VTGSAAPAVRRVAHLDTGHTWRGGQAQVWRLMRGLAARDIESRLLAPPGPLLDRARAAGFPTSAWSPRGDADLPALLHARHVLRSAQVDVAHCHDARAHALGVPAARLAGVPAVVVSRRVEFPVAGHPLSALKYRLPVDRYLCVSERVARTLADAGIEPERLAVVPSGIEEVPRATDVDLRRMLGLAADARLVGTAAALTAEKGHAMLLETAARLTRVKQDVHFVWLGDGPERAALEHRRSALGLEGRVHLLGFRDDASTLIGQCTVLASAARAEGLGTALLEAQALGVPVVATAVGGVPEIVADGVTGRLVPADDAAALAAALREALEHTERARAWAEQARVTVRAFGIERTVERTLEEYRKAMEGRRVRGMKPA
jgi:glycosyltransferase involved in cell wall biosynthesis